jgi:hypothetical protein
VRERVPDVIHVVVRSLLCYPRSKT